MPYVVIFSLVDRCEDLLKVTINIEGGLRMKLLIIVE